VKAFDGSHGAAHQDERIAHRLHSEDADVLLDEHRNHPLREALVVGIHHIQRHLDGVERESVLPRSPQHHEMDGGLLWPVKPM